MDSKTQDSVADVDNTQLECSTASPNPSPETSPPHNSTSTPRSTPKLPEGEDGGQLLPTPRTPKPWAWKCHRCHQKYEFRVTTRCLYDGHYFCSGAPTNRNNPRRNKKKQNSRKWVCTYIFDYSGWQAMKAWQGQKLETHGKEDQRESGCMIDCIRPGGCHPTTPASLPSWFGFRRDTDAFSNEPVRLDQQDTDFLSSSSLESDAENKARAGSKRERSATTDAPPEAPPAK
ncbi:hypothetical protein EMCG_07428 [[Emmonsia] crescens]|uniref:Uncharacterized protein n=1 Tax=[Emmonsia] crescens TaxID=73230 RepID=A0A0G2I8K2_9EURO|nr:hypothetical protein EMCG_07428 [Emmonsia crescens UAMH 3008]